MSVSGIVLARHRGSDSWAPASAKQQRAQASSILVVHPHELDSRAPLRRLPMNGSVRLRGEVLSPHLPPGVIQRNDEVSLRVD